MEGEALRRAGKDRPLLTGVLSAGQTGSRLLILICSVSRTPNLLPFPWGMARRSGWTGSF